MPHLWYNDFEGHLGSGDKKEEEGRKQAGGGGRRERGGPQAREGVEEKDGRSIGEVRYMQQPIQPL